MSECLDSSEIKCHNEKISKVIVPSPQKLKEDVQFLMEWMEKEPHLPNIEDEEWLKTFLYNNKFSLERTKHKLDNYYSYRSKYPEILMRNRDPLASELLQAKNVLHLATSKRLTKNGFKLVYSSWESNSEIFNPNDLLKRIFMLDDALNLENIRLSKAITIADCGNLNYHHYTKLTPALVAFGDIIINGQPTSCSIKNLIVRIIYYYTQQLFEKHRTWFLAQENISSNELLRSKTEDNMKGSFRKLDID